MMALRLPYSRHPLMRLMKRGMLTWMPGMITCEKFELFVVDYLENTLPAKQRKIFERHLLICPECIDYIEHYKQTIALAAQSTEYSEFKNAGNPPKDLLNAILDAQKRSSDD